MLFFFFWSEDNPCFKQLSSEKEPTCAKAPNPARKLVWGGRASSAESSVAEKYSSEFLCAALLSVLDFSGPSPLGSLGSDPHLRNEKETEEANDCPL